MKYVKWALVAVFCLAVYGFLDYALPSKQTVRITNVYNQLTEIGANGIFYASSDTGTTQTPDGRRDVRFIATVKPNGKPYVYRNEDTGWIWPPYFKYDSSNLHAVASDQVSTREAPKWVSVTSYGWRVAWLSIYPNAISIKPVAGPGAAPTNWAALIVLAVLGLLLLLFWRMWAQFRERTIDPAVASAGDAWDRIDARADQARDRAAQHASDARGWFGRQWDRLRGR